jgi:hypothetical protein
LAKRQNASPGAGGLQASLPRPFFSLDNASSSVDDVSESGDDAPKLEMMVRRQSTTLQSWRRRLVASRQCLKAEDDGSSSIDDAPELETMGSSSVGDASKLETTARRQSATP